MAKTNEEKTDGGLIILEKTTDPPSRYSEATLLKKLETLGVGRPSTYASIVSTLKSPDRGYAEEQGKAIVPTQKGMTLSHFLDEAFPDIINYDYSAKLEESLDNIAKGKVKQFDFLTTFYKQLEASIKNTKTIVIEKPAKEYADHDCPQCGGKLVKRNGRFGSFYGCENWSSKKCRYTEKIV